MARNAQHSPKNLRRTALLLALLGLGACNMAISDHPMFEESQRSTKIALENGIWLRIEHDCPVDTSSPRSAWPACADWLELHNNRIAAAKEKSESELPGEFLIVDGRPPIIQAAIEVRDERKIYGFMALDPVRFSRSHRVIEAQMWMVPCGVSTGTGASPHVDPYPGFSEECMPTSVKALRRAAAKGPAPPDDKATIVWTGPSDDQPTISSGEKK